MKYLAIIFLSFLLFSGSYAQQAKGPSAIDLKVKSLLSKMTLAEKAGQMTQLSVISLLKTKDGVVTEPHELDLEKLSTCLNTYKVGSILDVGGNAQTQENWRMLIETIQKMALKGRLKIPVLYGVDAIRGNNYTLNSVLFPQEIAQAASFNPAMAKKIATVAAYETRASFIPWTFSPVLDLGRQPLWPRIWETYGEDPLLVQQMGNATIQGFQGDQQITDKYHVTACLKHFMGYSMPLSGHDRTPAWIPEVQLREYFLPPFAAAIRAGAKTVMINSAEINGTPVHASKHILTDILKNELQFKGFALSDWQDIQYLYQRHKIAKNNKDAVAIAINAGIDMSMVPYDYTFTSDLIELVKEGRISMSRIDDAVSRILKVKYETGIFEQPYGQAGDYPDFGSAAHHALNFQAAAECITLLKNKDHILPLAIGKKILVAGPAANSMRVLNGGWSRNWQGDNSDITESGHDTFAEAISKVFGAANVSYSAGADFDKVLDIEETVAKAANADVIVLCLGESSYTENMGNSGDLNLSASQVALAQALSKTGKPIVLVLAEGRPKIISGIEPLAAAVVHTYIAGNEGGNALAAILAGTVNPSGKLPYTYPRLANSLMNYYHKYTETIAFDQVAGYDPQWEFGYGLSYTTFKYANLRLNQQVMTKNGSLTATVEVTNSGKVAGKETVLLYSSDLVASITPEVKRLRAFRKVELQPGETKTITFAISTKDLAFVNAALQTVTEPGEFKLSVDSLSVNFLYQ